MAILKLTKKLKKQWVSALRSGKYKQGMGQLCEDRRYCCLGVLGSITGLLHKQKISGKDAILTDHNGSLIEGLDCDIQDKLAQLNDDKDFNCNPLNDFNIIADYIEKNVEPIR